MRLVFSLGLLLSLVQGQRPYFARDADGFFTRSFIDEEQKRFLLSGSCASSDVSPRIATCESQQHECNLRNQSSCSPVEVMTLQDLKWSSCRCDARCSEYLDCCMDKVSIFYETVGRWSCREVRGENVSRIPIYVYQICPDSWSNVFVKDMCETEASEREKMGLEFDHLQDIPVLSEASGRFYRNVYCALCNDDSNLVKWDSYLYCNGDSESPFVDSHRDVDFSSSVYIPRTQNYRKVRVDGSWKNCQIIVRNFNIKKILTQHGGRLCKPAIDTCPKEANFSTRAACQAYTSYVYRSSYSSKRDVYRNFHCALCNGVPTDDNLHCIDPLSELIYGTPWVRGRESSLSMLFDFNLVGGWESVGGHSSCLMTQGKIWDPVLKRCKEYTCGKLYEREGYKCVSSNASDIERGLKDDCVKEILSKDEFLVLNNGSVYINSNNRILADYQFEVHKVEKETVIEIAVCFDEDLHFLPYSSIHTWLSYITLGVSIVCLVLHLIVYALIEKLRNCPGKILMSLSSSLLCGHFSLLVGPHFESVFWLCYMIGIATHFGYLSAFVWMTVMAVDIHGTFSVTQSHNTRKSKAFPKYALYAWTPSIAVVIASICIDSLVPSHSDYRAKYGNPTCWFNSGRSLLVFFVAPATALFVANISLFVITALHVRKVSHQTKMVNNFSNKARLFLNLKLIVVLGLTWILGLLAAITRMDAFWYPFIVLNGLQGALIFIAFTIKRSILHMLAVRLKIRSDKYRLGKSNGLKAAMYSSLTNLTSLQTISSRISTSTNQKEMLKAFRRINPDIVIESKAH